MKTAYVAFAIGCPRSNLDAALLVKYFKKNCLKVTTRIEKADIILFSTCGFDIGNENRSIELLSIANRLKNKRAHLVAFGCLPGINKTRIINEFDITTITRRTLDKLDRIIGAEISIRDVKEPNDLSKYDFIKKCFNTSERKLGKDTIGTAKKFLFDTLSKVKSGNISYPLARIWKKFPNSNCSSNVYNIRISKGCNGSCSYCAIRHSVGPLDSKPLDCILEEFEEGLSKGYKRFHLMGEDVGGYGEDIRTNIVDLLSELFMNKEKFKLSFSDFSPKWLVKYFPQIFEIFKINSSKFGLLGFPIQSASERILELMCREYTAKDAKKCMQALVNVLPEPRLKTHVLVGFPEETEKDFLDTMAFIKTFKFETVWIYEYSDRPNTDASTFHGKVPEDVIKSRVLRMKSSIGSKV